MKLLAEAITKYSQANDGYLPAADRWCDLLMEQDENLSRDNFKHPEIQGSSVAFNKNLDGLRLVDIPDDVVLLFEAKGGWNLIGGEELLNKANPNRNFVDVLLVNREIKTYWVKCGGVKAYDGTFMPLRWKP